jgi:hypothetical protein
VTKVEAQVNSVFVDNVDNILDPQEGVTELIVNTVDNIVDKKSDRTSSRFAIAKTSTPLSDIGH